MNKDVELDNQQTNLHHWISSSHTPKSWDLTACKLDFSNSKVTHSTYSGACNLTSAVTEACSQKRMKQLYLFRVLPLVCKKLIRVEIIAIFQFCAEKDPKQ